MSAFLFLLLSIPSGILRAWVVQHLWAWFVAPTFQVSTPKVAIIYGLAWFVVLLWPTSKSATHDEKQSVAQNMFSGIVFSVLMSLFGLLIGFVANGIAT